MPAISPSSPSPDQELWLIFFAAELSASPPHAQGLNKTRLWTASARADEAVEYAKEKLAKEGK